MGMKAGWPVKATTLACACQFSACQAEWCGMEQERVRKTYTYKLKPTPEQERALDTVLWRCRMLYNTALEERKTAWDRCHVSVNYYYRQKAELPDLNETRVPGIC